MFPTDNNTKPEPIPAASREVATNIIKRLSRRFRDDANGNVAMLFTLMAVPLLVGAGMAVDIARHGFHEQRLNTSVDAAALAVAKMEDGATQEEMETLARSYIDINYTPRVDLRGNEVDLDVSLVGNVVTVTAEVDVPTTITSMIGVHDMTARTTSEVTKEILGTEIALVLDNTGSMRWSGKIEALESASNTLLDVLFDGVNSTNKLKVAIVPFSGAVNVGTGNSTQTWLDTTGLSDVSRMNFINTNWHNWKAWTKLANRSWNGCVQARAMPYDVQDDVPTTGNPDTLFAPYFAPDEPDPGDSGVDGDYRNSYLNDSMDDNKTKLDKRQRKHQKYVNANASGDGGPEYNCGIAPLTPLTNVEQDLRDAVDAMVATGFTNITQGISWGWHVLSPSAPFEEGNDYNDAAWKKYMIVMTDGDNDWGDGSLDETEAQDFNGSLYTGYGFIKQDRLDETNPDNADDVLDDRTATICTNVKNATGNASTAITVYTITFGNPGQSTRDMMETCATDTEKYFHAPNSASLTAVFEQIADEIGSVRLSK